MGYFRTGLEQRIIDLEKQVAKLRAALERLIADYEDETGENAMAAREALK